MDQAIKHCTAGLGIWEWASSDRGGEPDVVMACCGDVPTLETLAAVELMRQHAPEIKVRVVNVVDLMRLQPPSEHPHGLTDRDFDALFTTDKPIIFAFHGYPWLIHRLTYRRRGHDNIHVRGYKEEGTTTTPFDMCVINDLDRFHLVMDVIDRVPGLAARAAYAKQALRDKLIDHHAYIDATATTCRRSRTGRGVGKRAVAGRNLDRRRQRLTSSPVPPTGRHQSVIEGRYQDRPDAGAERWKANRGLSTRRRRASFASGKTLDQYGLGGARVRRSAGRALRAATEIRQSRRTRVANTRERYKAAARAVRDILSDRWLRTNKTYARENPKWVYYLSIEFLIGRSLGNNVMNLMLDPDRRGELRRRRPRMVGDSARGARRGPRQWRSRPARGLLPQLDGDDADCRRWATGCATSTASSSRRSATAGRRSARTTGSAIPIRGRSCARPRASR